ncbi:hypothetical protein [Rugamonas apoptosis]|uniref:Uncharacterized protein n=1 Tax=Rugamonas apoptosis TaxID=2758570 RepID=A0A7W2F6C3_9BURK|nr:hypothetical protein [Rugamonas apoptosis]MBA5685925.1 hypothetical protein [Rugamonas apoptosis]
MQATIYISDAAMATVNAIKDLDYYDRVSLSDDPATDLSTSPGYYLNTNELRLASLPPNAVVSLQVTPTDIATSGQRLTAPANLRGPIFSGAPNLPQDYAKIIKYWSPLVPTTHHRGAVFFQNVLNCYCVKLTDSDEAGETIAGDGNSGSDDILLSDGLVIIVQGLAAAVEKLDPDHFVALTIPINTAMLGIEVEGYQSTQEYLPFTYEQSETLYLRVSDVLASPDPDSIILSALHSLMSSYGYTY